MGWTLGIIGMASSPNLLDVFDSTFKLALIFV
jgi:hypothetical protein